ncbi:MAG: hypothetical protein ACI8P0_004968, partial [Planctomycetaceae bacterium]
VVPSESSSNSHDFSLSTKAWHGLSKQQLRHSSSSARDRFDSVFPEHVSYTSYLNEMSLFV